jgi:Arc/MetJ-type ribon-helix-helix transcriptional regulator
MQIISLNIPGVYIDVIKKLLDQGLYPSRSEFVRVALRTFLKRELKMVEKFLELNESEKKVEPLKEKAKKGRSIDMRSIRRGWEKNYPKID